MTTALSKLRKQVTEAVLNDRPWVAKSRRLQAGLGRKFDRLVPEEVARALSRPWTTDPNTFVNHHLDAQVVDLLLLPTADLRFFLARLAGRTSRSIVYGAARGQGVECFRDATTFLINESDEVGATVSWSRCISISKETGLNAYPKHLYRRDYRGNEATCGADMVPRVVEFAAVRGGLGYGGGGRLFFFARFATPVGLTGRRGARTETHYLKVQLDRVQRPATTRRLKGGGTSRPLQGMEIHMHGYPISEAELRADFQVGAAQVIAAPITI